MKPSQYSVAAVLCTVLVCVTALVALGKLPVGYLIGAASTVLAYVAKSPFGPVLEAAVMQELRSLVTSQSAAPIQDVTVNVGPKPSTGTGPVAPMMVLCLACVALSTAYTTGCKSALTPADDASLAAYSAQQEACVRLHTPDQAAIDKCRRESKQEFDARTYAADGGVK